MSALLLKIILFSNILLGSVGQIMLRKGMKEKIIDFKSEGIVRNLIKIYINPFVLIGSFVYMVSTLVWIGLVSKVELSYAYPMVSLNFVMIALLSKAAFNEKVSRVRWISIIMIVIGVSLLSVS